MQSQLNWFERADYAKISDLNEPSLVKLFNHLETKQYHFLDQLSRKEIEWKLPWPQDALHQWSRRWEYPYVASSVPETSAKILDAGSGFTFFPFYLAGLGHQVFAVDRDCQLKAYYDAMGTDYSLFSKGSESASQGKLEFSVQDISSLAFEANTFDMVYCISVLEHLSEKEAVLNEFARVLKPGGTLILTCDISLDGSTNNPLYVFFDMLAVVESLYEYISRPVFRMDGDTLTTNYCRKKSPEILPWRKRKFSLRWLIDPRFYIRHRSFTEVKFSSLAVAGMKLSVK